MKARYLGQKRTYYRKNQYLVRLFGFDTWMKEGDFKRMVTNGQVLLKANKPLSLKAL